MAKVIIPIATGFEEIEAVSIVDVLRRAEITVLMVALDDTMQVCGANGISVVCDQNINTITADTIDMIVLPGGWGGTDRLAADTYVQDLLKAMDAKNKPIGAICAAPYALHTAGVLKENFTCYPSAEEKIRLDGYQGDAHKVVQDGNVITSRGPGTSICFALEIVKKLKGQEMYEGLRAGLLAEYC